MKNQNLIAKLIGFIILISSSASFSQSIQNSRINLDAELKYEFITNKLEEGWIVEDKGLNKIFTASSTAKSPGWENSGGAILLFNIGAFPSENFSASAGFEAISGYADRLWMPINEQHRLYNDGQNIKWIKGDAKYSTEKWYLRYFKGVGHYHWAYEGDMFNLYPEQFETERYLRVSGRAVPDGFEGNINAGRYGNLTVVGGQEIVWGYKNGIYAKYNFRFSKFENAVIYKNEIIPYGEPDERLSAGEISTKFNIAYNIPFQIGLLYQPFRLGWDYQYTEGNSTKLHTAKTEQKDAIATKFILTTHPYPAVDELSFECGYFGLVAGNKYEIIVKSHRPLIEYLLGAIEYTYRKPLIGPLPFIYEGTPENMGPALINPRGPESPFWVNWSNREASILSLIFTFDPTPATWFYKYQPNILDEWNLNPNEDASLSFALKLSLEHYPTTTDRMFYYDESGNVIWEPYYMPGAWATKDYLSNFSLIAKLKFPRYRIVLNFSGGDSLATSSLAYTDRTNKEKPLTSFFSGSLSLIRGPWNGRISYGQNVWGPEEWHRHFGETVDRLYQVGLARAFGEYFNLSIDYTALREVDEKYYAPELGSYDEIKLLASMKFSSTLVFK